MTLDIVGLQTPEETEDYLQKETDTKRSAILLFADSSRGKKKCIPRIRTWNCTHLVIERFLQVIV